MVDAEKDDNVSTDSIKIENQREISIEKEMYKNCMDYIQSEFRYNRTDAVRS